MKKTFIIILAVLALAFAGCSEKSTEKEDTPITENITREQEATEEIPETTEEKEEAPENQTEEKTDTKEEEKSDTKEEEKNDTKKEIVESEKEVAPAQVNLSAINSEIKNTVSASGAMDLDADAISNLYGILPGDISQAAGFVVMEGTFPHEAIMVEAKDSAAAERVEALLKEKHAAFKEQSKGYDAENYDLASRCRVERKGNHISMFLTPDFEAMRAVYLKYVK